MHEYGGIRHTGVYVAGREGGGREKRGCIHESFQPRARRAVIR